MAPALSGILQFVSPAEQKIIDLSAKVISMQDTADFEPAVQELRASIHGYLEGLRDKVAELALIVASESESKAAD